MVDDIHWMMYRPVGHFLIYSFFIKKGSLFYILRGGLEVGGVHNFFTELLVLLIFSPSLLFMVDDIHCLMYRSMGHFLLIASPLRLYLAKVSKVGFAYIFTERGCPVLSTTVQFMECDIYSIEYVPCLVTRAHGSVLV